MGKKSVILCVDDETIVLKSLVTQLGRIFGEEYIIETAESGEEALEIIEEIQENNETLPLIISDQLMPGMKGNELLKKVHSISANTLKILLTGQADAAAVGDAVNNAKLYRYISKPWAADDLILTVSEALKSFFQERKLEEQNKKLQEYNQQLEEKVKQRTIEIQEAHKNILASINYASFIQQGMFSQENTLKKAFKDYFIFFKPKDIVSGDFYWFYERNNEIWFSVADCTGHGVPGAFVSILGMSYLNEIMAGHSIENTSQLLNHLREKIITTFTKNTQKRENMDGMDIAMCQLNRETMKLNYSGANNPCILVREQQLIELKPDKMPIGKHVNENIPFKFENIDVQSNDAIYLYSDGFQDQFGDITNKKFMRKNFKELLRSISHLPMNSQKTIIEETLRDWKGAKEQVDDILVMGIKI